MKRCAGATLVALFAAGAIELAFDADLAAREPQRGGQVAGPAIAAPAFQVDPMWPKPLPNGWILGSVTGLAVDSQDHIWIVHRGAASLTARTENGLGTDPPTAELCCRPAPPVLEFDAAGNLISSWGGPGQGFDWPQSPGGIAVDAKGGVWIVAAGVDAPAGRRGGGGGAARGGAAGGGGAGAGAAGAGAAGGGAAGAGGGGAARGGGGGGAATPAAPRPADAHILKFSRTGQFQMAIGKAGETGASDSKTALNRPANVEVDLAANEVFVADGFVNRRVVVFDATSGAYKRHFGAYGTPPDDANPGPYDPNGAPSKQFRTVGCASLAKDGTLYVCDRQNDRIQVFRKDGTFVKEAMVAKATLGSGSVWDIAFSPDAQQRFLYVADGANQKIHVLVRDTLQVLASFGDGGRWPGHFYAVSAVGVDSRGNVYTAETLEGKRVQKFVLRPVTSTPRGRE